MEIFNFKTVDSLPTLYHPELDLLVISDLHLGLEKSMTFKGSYVPKFQLEDLKKDLKEAKQETEASRILLNGDLKHEFKYTRFSEKEEIEDFLEFLKIKFDEIIVVKGNHDTFLEEVIKGDQVKYTETYLEGQVLFIHGHSALSKVEADDYETIVIGHEHPALALEDEIGITEKVDCFLYGETRSGKNLVVMPAFSKISGGSKVNNMPQSELLSPILRNEVDVDNLKAVAVSREAGLFEFPELEKI